MVMCSDELVGPYAKGHAKGLSPACVAFEE